MGLGEMYVDKQEEEATVDFPQGQVTAECYRQVEELEQLHSVLDALQMRLRLGGVLRSTDPRPGETTEKSQSDIREVKVPLAVRYEDNNREIARATFLVRELIDLIEV